MQDGEAAIAIADTGGPRRPAATLGAAGKGSDASRTSRPPPRGDREEAPEKLGRRSEGHSYTFFGNTFNETSFSGARHGEQRATWATALSWIERSDCEFGPAGPDPVFDAACQAWTEQSIIVLRHQQGAMDRAERLLHRLAHWATGQEATLRLLGVANDVVPPLGDLAADEAWPADSHGTLLLVQRRQDQKTTMFLSSNNGVGVKALRERLRTRKSRLLISVAAEWDAGEGRLDPFDKSVKTLEVTGAAHRTAAPRVDEQESPFDAVPRIVASLFGCLGVPEFKALVDDLLTGIAPPQPPAAAPGTSAPAASLPAKPTRHERWLAGHVDQVLSELGVRYLVSVADASPLSGTTRGAGYSLSDPASPYAESGWVIAHHPALLAGRTDSLLDRYLIDDQASARYRESFLGTLARLDAAGVRSVSAEWLMEAWQRAVARHAGPGVIGERLYALVEYLSSDSQEAEPRLPMSVIDALAGAVVGCELRFQVEQGLQPLRTVFAAANQDASAETRDFWTQLRETTAAGPAIQELERCQLTSLWALLLLARRWPRAVAAALARVLDETTATAAPWGQAAAELPGLHGVPRYAALALHYLMALAAAEAPPVWTAVAGGVVQAREADVRAGFAAAANLRAKAPLCGIQGQRLAFLCLEALAPQLDPDGRAGSVLARLELLPVHDVHSAGDAGMIGRLLAMAHLEVGEEPRLGVAGAGVLPVADIVRFLRTVALDLQADDEVDAAQAAGALARIAAGVRAVLPLQHRRGLIGQGRESLAAQQATREAFEADDDIDMVRRMRRRIRATQLVLRCLSAA